MYCTSVNLDVKCNVLYEGDCLRWTIYVHYTWEMALNISSDTSFSNVVELGMNTVESSGS
jgi:hypothetical protein